MNTLKKATKILSIVDIVLCVLATSLSFLFSVLVDVLHLPWDYLTWVLLILSALASLAIVMFVLAVIIRSISSKKIIKEKYKLRVTDKLSNVVNDIELISNIISNIQ